MAASLRKAIRTPPLAGAVLAAGLLFGCGSGAHSPVPDGHSDAIDSGADDGGSPDACGDIDRTYAAALVKAQECTLGAADQCTIRAQAGFWCSCTTFVNDSAETLAAIVAQYQAASCFSICNGSCGQVNSLACVADATSSTGARCRQPTLLNLSGTDAGRTFSVPVAYEVDILLQDIGPNGYGNDVLLSSDAATVIEVTIPATAPNPGGPTHLYRLQAGTPGEVVVQIPFTSVTGDAGRPAYTVTLEITSTAP